MSWIAYRRFLERFFSLGKETFFPRFCSICHKEGSFLCEPCFSILSQGRRQSQVCGHCGARETPEGQICFACAGAAPHDGIFAALHYNDPRIAHIIHLFKYRFVRDLGTPLGVLLATALLQSELPLPDAILPVPLHPRRERWRGWNQADILAKSLIQNFPQEITPPILNDTLIRTRFTAPQMSLQDKSLRKENIEGAFQISTGNQRQILKYQQHQLQIVGKNFWVIDDVAASGSTIATCAQTLKEHGARHVFGIVVAR
ncbi:MAG: hypothetical protein WBC29_04050 [Candidatus Moraniibacteriota bacterium]